MPGFYKEGEYDLSGFAVGVVDRSRIIDGSGIKKVTVLSVFHPAVIHSNGYSLVRKILFEKGKMDVSAFVPDLGSTLGDELLKPTRIYVRAFNALKEKVAIKGMAHITGGGITATSQGYFPRDWELL